MENRRKSRTDPLTLLLRLAAIVGWLLLIGVQIIGWIAAPELETVLTRFYRFELRDYWQQEWVQWFPFLLGACTLLSLLALGINPLRSRRKSDSKRVHLRVLLLLTLAGYGFYWFQILGNVG